MEHHHNSHYENEQLDRELYNEDYRYGHLSEEEKKKKRKSLKERKAHKAEKDSQKK